MPASTLKLFRQTHLYFGVFISPALLFFALTGALQTFSLHETTQGSNYKPAKWIVALGQLHKKQTLTVPQRKPPSGPAPVSPQTLGPATQDPQDKVNHHRPGEAASQPAGPSASPAPSTSAAPKPPDNAPRKSHLPMKIFFLLVSIGLFSSTLTGLYMAYKFNNNKLVITALLLAGIVLPLLLLPF